MSAPAKNTSAEIRNAAAGFVHLVGAGPGDPELLTIKALRAIEAADVVVHDRLVSAEIMALVPASAERIDVGKAANHHPVPQDAINTLLITLALSGKRVARLKGGDPLLFGRGGEEACALTAANVAFAVVPGITSAQGTAASLRMPLTHRKIASGVRFVTGHRQGNAPLAFDWAGLADPETTIVVYMGLSSIAEIAAQLIAHGRAPTTPVLAVSRATRTDEVRAVATLASIIDMAGQAGLEAPTLFVIGEVVSLAGSAAPVAGSRADLETVHAGEPLAVAAE